MTKNEVLPKLRNIKTTNNGWLALCPAHGDKRRSLSVAEKDGKVLFNCFKGCSYLEIISALGISGNGSSSKLKAKIIAVYDYTDEHGNVLYQNVRLEGKEFRQKHLDKTGKEVWNLEGVRRVPYYLPDLIKLPKNYAVVLAEGEKDADTLKANGLFASNHKNWKPEFNYLLKNKDVVIFQDHDISGKEQAEKTARIVLRDANAVKIVDCFADEPMSDKHGKDVSDYLKTYNFDELLELIRQTPDFQITDNTNAKNNYAEEIGFNVVSLADVEEKEIIWLWKPFIAIGEFTILEGIEGLGKSWLGCALACAIAGGKKLPFSESEALEPAITLMLSAEDSLSHTIKPRLISMNANLERIFALDDVFSLDNPNDLIKFESVIAQYEPKLVIIDPIFSYTGGKNLNQESESRPLARKLIAIAQKFDCAIIGVRHLGKAKGGGDARAAGLGSIAWRASARSVLLIGQDEESGEKAVCQTKNNLCEQSKIAIGFEIINGQFLWKGQPSALTKEKMLAQPKDEETKAEQTEAVEFLREVLSDGERSSKEVEKEAKEVGITTYAFRKAKSILKVKSFKKGGTFGGEKGWYLKLEEVENSAEDVVSGGSQYLQSNIGNKTSCGNGLAEDVEIRKNKHLQRSQTISSNGLVPMWKPKEMCKCGTEGILGEACKACNEIIIPF